MLSGGAGNLSALHEKTVAYGRTAVDGGLNSIQHRLQCNNTAVFALQNV